MNFTSKIDDAAISLESVLCTEELTRRPFRPPGYHTECDALAELTAVLTDSPRAILQRLVDIVLKVCQAGSAGVSLLSEKDNGKTCYWAAVSGAWHRYASSEIPRDDCPCGVALARDTPQLFIHPGRHFTKLAGITPAVEEVLLIPFHVMGKAVGTVWVMSHNGNRRFDCEDVRLISRLSKFAAGAYQMQETVGALQQQGSELRESRERYQTLFESIDEGFCIIQMIFDERNNPVDYLFLQTNPAFERETGLANALGKTMREMIPDHDDHWFEIYGRVALTGEAVRFEDYSQSLHRWFSVFAFPVADHETRQVGLIFSNITERKRSEQAVKYHNKEIEVLLNAAPLGVYLVDSDFRVRAANPIAHSTFGDIPESIIGFDFEELMRKLWKESYADEVVDIFRHTLESGEPYVAHERAEFRIDRNVTEYYEWHLNRITLPDGRYGVVCYFRDISQQVEARKEIERSRDALRETDRRKDEFLAILAHELRNPLAPIRNSAQILRLPEADAGARRAASETLDRQIAHMVRLVDDLLDVSRITRGKIALRKQPIELSSVINQAVEAVRPLWEDRYQELKIVLPPEPIRMNADPSRLAQVVGNLLNNAYKFSRQDGQIQLSLRREGGQAVIRVRDNGIGIAEDQLSRIFDMFTQVDTSLERPQSGLGIGLTLVKNLVEMQGGSVEATSPGIGNGSEFAVRLPILDVPCSARSSTPPVKCETETGRRRILIVDDNRDQANSLLILLKIAGHEVHVAIDGLEAVNAATRLQPDVILLDIGLPKLNGYEAARQIRQQQKDKHIVLVAVTGWGQEEDRRRSREAGFDTHMVKPLDFDQLKRLLADLRQKQPQ